MFVNENGRNFFLLCMGSFKKSAECGFMFLKYFSVINLKKVFFSSAKCCEIDMEKLSYLLCTNAFIQETALTYQKMWACYTKM